MENIKSILQKVVETTKRVTTGSKEEEKIKDSQETRSIVSENIRD